MTTDISHIAVPPRIEQALRQASQRTGTDFNYLLNTAIRESGLKSGAQSKSSSATGLFQFIETTWLEMVKTAGGALGLGDYADKIEQTPGGRYKVADRRARQEILALRNDPQTAALMAGAFARESQETLAGELGRAPSHGELYMAHFLGRSGASHLIEAARETPDALASEMFPKAASANRSIFYDRNGDSRTVAEVHERLIARHEDGPTRLAGAEIDEADAMPVISPAAATYLKPVDLAARSTQGGRSWDRGLFVEPSRPERAASSGGPLVLDSARLVALIEENLDDGRTPAATTSISASGEGPFGLAAAKRPPGLLDRKVPFLDLFRSG